MNCLRCGYDLSYTPIDLACPECGLAAERSLTSSAHPDDARPRWVWSVAIATLLLLVAYLMPVVALALEVAADDDVVVAPLVLLAAAALLHWIANIMLSRDDRQRPLRWWQRAHRWALRLAPIGPLLAAIGGAMLGIAAALWPLPTTWPAPSTFTRAIANHLPLWELLIAVFAGLFIFCPTLTFLRLRWLAKRLGRNRLAEHIGIVAAGSVVGMAACLFVAVPAGGIIRHSGVAFALLVGMPAVLFVLFTVWSVGVLFVICPLFFRSARHARNKWIAADAARRVSLPRDLQKH